MKKKYGKNNFRTNVSSYQRTSGPINLGPLNLRNTEHCGCEWGWISIDALFINPAVVLFDQSNCIVWI